MMGSGFMLGLVGVGCNFDFFFLLPYNVFIVLFFGVFEWRILRKLPLMVI